MSKDHITSKLLDACNGEDMTKILDSLMTCYEMIAVAYIHKLSPEDKAIALAHTRKVFEIAEARIRAFNEDLTKN